VKGRSKSASPAQITSDDRDRGDACGSASPNGGDRSAIPYAGGNGSGDGRNNRDGNRQCKCQCAADSDDWLLPWLWQHPSRAPLWRQRQQRSMSCGTWKTYLSAQGKPRKFPAKPEVWDSQDERQMNEIGPLLVANSQRGPIGVYPSKAFTAPPALPMSIWPEYFAFSSAITLPMSLMDVAPTAAMMP
jgi:hypothetical protein